ncbi:MAG: hypothetical protein JXB32_07865 [Deltaproteobacteria bacterium]|nr:hypothetical protein [Deltaproteobacteria bacterium]
MRVGNAVGRVVGALLAVALAGCPGTPGAAVGLEGSGIGRMCGEGVPDELLAAQAVASAYRVSFVRDLQLVETDTPGVRVAVYRLGPPDARPQELFAATTLVEPGCVTVVAQGEACDPLAFAPIYLPPFAEEAVHVEPATFEPWEATGDPAVQVSLGAAAVEPEADFPRASARGRCVFGFGGLPDGRIAAGRVFAWTEAAHTVEHGRNGHTFVTAATTTVAATPGPEPRPLTLESVVLDTDCADVEDRRLACVEECLLARPAEDAGDEAPTATTDCEAECAGTPAEPGRWCSAFADRITEWRAGRRDDAGRVRYATTGRQESRAALDAACLLGETRPAEDPPVPEAGELLVRQLESCRADDAGAGAGYSGRPHGAPGSGSSGSR